MKLYFAGADASLDFFEELKVDRLLIAYPFIQKRGLVPKSTWFIDSGAFTAFNTGERVDLDAYIEWIKTTGVTTYASLDDITSPEITLRNYKAMRKAGLNPIPTFHYGEQFDYLRTYMKLAGYVAIGGLVPMKTNPAMMRPFLDRCFSIIRDTHKVHGFGIVNWELLCRYPWYSVDATSWQNPTRWGQHFKFARGRLNRSYHYTPSTDRFLPTEKAHQRAVEQFRLAEDYLTRLWQKRGITWPT